MTKMTQPDTLSRYVRENQIGFALTSEHNSTPITWFDEKEVFQLSMNDILRIVRAHK